jgi:hypothetical protein
MMDEKAATAVLARAMAVVDAAEVPDVLREAAFTAAVGLLASGQPDLSSAGGAQPSPGDGLGAAEGGLLDRIASGLGIDRRRAGNLFAEKDGAPELIVKASTLPQTKAAGAHDVALLVMASRQLSGLDEYTEPDVLRDSAKRYGKFDPSNFGKHMKSLDNYIITSGKGKAAKRRLTQPGLEAAADLARRYLEES